MNLANDWVVYLSVKPMEECCCGDDDLKQVYEKALMRVKTSETTGKSSAGSNLR